jgi:hypothetical protein
MEYDALIQAGRNINTIGSGSGMTWMARTSRAMTGKRIESPESIVMAGRRAPHAFA